MKLVAAVLVTLVAVALGQGIARVDFGTGRVGYDNDCINVIKDNGECAGTFALPANMQPNVTGVGNSRAWAIVAIQARNINSASAKTTTYVRRGTAAAATRTSFAAISRPGGAATDVDAMYYGAYEIPQVNGTFPDGVAVLFFVESCSGCRESADYKITVFWAVGSAANCQPATGNPTFGRGPNACELLPFPMREDSYSWDQVVMQGQYGTPAYTTLAAESFLYIAVDTNSANAVTLLYEANRASFPATTGWPQDNDGATARILPLGVSARRTGAWRTGGMRLPAGTWYVSPYMAQAGSSGGRFDFAFGINHEPSSAGIAVPSLLLAAILAIAALFM
jgi:hypothetical protein